MKRSIKYMALIVILIATLALTSTSVEGDEVLETVIFAWDYGDTTYVTTFELHWAETIGGPYLPLEVIPAIPPFESPTQTTVTGTSGTTETRFFVLRACGDTPQQDGTTLYLCSEWSNEVSHDFWIPVGAYEVPINFRIIAE